MLRRLALIVATVFVFTSLIATSAHTAERKTGYINVIRVLDEYSKAKESRKVFDEKVKAKDEEGKKLADEIKKLEDELAILSDKAKAEKQKVIDDKKITLRDFFRKAQAELVKEERNMFAGIQGDMEKVIIDYSKENGYDYIFDSRTLLYGDEKSDLTDEILKKLNKK